MSSGGTPMRTVSRPRTRSQWDEHYRNFYNEQKRKNLKSGGTGERDEQVRNVVDSESIVGDGDGGKSLEEQDFAVIVEKRAGEQHVHQSGSCARRSMKRTKNGVEEFSGSRNIRGHARKRIDEEEDDNVASVSQVLGGKRKNDGDGEFEYLGEEVVSNGSSLKVVPESRSGSRSKVGILDEVVSCNTKRCGSMKVRADDGGKSGQCGRGRPQIKPLDSKHIPDDDAASLDNFMDSGSSTENSDGSDCSVDLRVLESQSSSEKDDKFFDEDYRPDESSTSDDSEISYYGSAVEGRKDVECYADENDNLMKGEVENSSNRTDYCKRSSNRQKQEDVVIIVDEKKKFPKVWKSMGISTEKERLVELERDNEIDEGYHAAHDSGHNKAPANQKKEQDTLIIVEDNKFCSFRKSARINQKRSGESSGLSRIYEPRSNYRCMDEARKAACDVSKEVNDVLKSGLKKSIPKSGESASSMGDESKSLRDEGSCHTEWVLERGQRCSKKVVKLSKRKTHSTRNLDLIKILVESINTLKEESSPIGDSALTQKSLPLKFRFEDEVQPIPKKSEWEKQIDSLFCDLELGLRESEIDCVNSSVIENDDLISIEIDKSPAACCGRGEHQAILDEQIGIVCKYCTAVILDIKYVLPPFYTPTLGRQERKDFDESPSPIISEIQFQDSACRIPDSIHCAKGTVWDLIPGVEKEMYPHQREGFEFMWRNIAGDISIEKLKQPLPDGGRGCIISHAPGTGKTRLTIVFLLTFLKLYPTCHPVIIAPRGMLPTWESEIIKWHVDVPFHNLNKEELSGNEKAVAAKFIGLVGAGGTNRDFIRLLKLYSWTKGRSILGISYELFKKLAGEDGKKGQIKEIRKLLLELPGLLVLDEGHTPRNNQSLIWKALTKVATQRRIILSGTPFQNNLTELYNTLCLVNPKFVNLIGSEYNISCETGGQESHVARRKWTSLTSSIGKNTDDGLKKLKAMLDPFIHVHKGTILEERLPGLRDTLVFLHPTEMQKTLLEIASKEKQIFRRIRLVSLVSVHPSLIGKMRVFSVHKSRLEKIKSDIDAGVKTKFVMKLIRLADALGERVLIFSQFIDPLLFIKKRIKSHFSWNQGREVLYMDGSHDVKQRQESISSFNDDTSEAKVLLASEKACSEGINLVGASRVVLLDTVWNPSVEKQAISRAYRLGQKKIVYVYRLFTSGTEVRQYAQQIEKERISQLIFSPVDGQACQSGKSSQVLEDKVLEAMLFQERSSGTFEKIIQQPKESDLVEIFGLVDRK